MSSFSSDEDLFHDYDDVAPLSPSISHSNPTNTEFDLNEISGSAEEFFNNQVIETNDADSNATILTAQAPNSESNVQNAEVDWDTLNGSVGDFFNFDHSNDNNSVESTDISTEQPIESAPISFNIPVGAQSVADNSHRKATVSREKSSRPLSTFNYEKVKGKSSQRCRRFPDILPEDKSRNILQNTGKHQLWYFILNLLNDFTKKSVIVWTGHQRHFRIKNTKLFSHLWSKHKKTADVQWESLQRTMRTCGKNGMLMAVPSTTHGGQNEDGLYGYVIEVSSYINMTREELDCVIKLHCETGPLTVGSPIDSSFGYPEGTKLRVMPAMPLDSEGNLLHPIPDHFITVLPHSQFTVPIHPIVPTVNSEIIVPRQSTPLLSALLSSNNTPIPNFPNIPAEPTPHPLLPPPPPLQLPVIDFSEVFNNDGTMNVHQLSDGLLTPSIVPLDYFNQSLPAQNNHLGFNNQPFHGQNQPFYAQHLQFPGQNQPIPSFHPYYQPCQPLNTQYHPHSQQSQHSKYQFHNQNQPFQ